LAYGKNLRYSAAYRNAWAYQNDPEKFVDAIGETYAPKQNYSATVKSVIGTFKLKEYDEEMLFSPSGLPPAGECR